MDGMDTRLVPPRRLGARVGTVFQDSQARFFTGSVGEEVAFSLELTGARSDAVHRQTATIIERMGLGELESRRPDRLSAGERARLGIAAALGRDPAVLLLDEPVTHLDPEGARAVVTWVGELSRADGLTVILAEHRFGVWRGEIDRAVFLEDGRPGGEPETLIVGDGCAPHPSIPPVKQAGVRAEGLSLSFDGRQVLEGVNLTIAPGEVVGLVGPNGSGKTTLLRCLAGLQRPDRGTVTFDGEAAIEAGAGRSRRIGYVPQPPSRMLFAETVREEVTPLKGRNGHGPDFDACPWIEGFGLGALVDRHPRDLSAGERQRVALAAVLAQRPSIVLLDEPTLGMEARRMVWLRRLLADLSRAGSAVVVATHDAAFVAAAAGRAVVLDHGRIVADGKPAAVLGSHPIFGPALAAAATDTEFVVR